MEVSDYFEQYVWPNYESFRADPGRKLLAMNAVVAAYHMADWIAACRVGPGVAGGIKDGDVRRAVKQVRKDVLEACPDFALIEDAATAYKHVVTRDKTGAKSARECGISWNWSGHAPARGIRVGATRKPGTTARHGRTTTKAS